MQPKANKLIKYIHVCICACIRPPAFLRHPTQIPFRDLESLTYQLLPIPTSSHLTLPSTITAQECSLGPQHTAHTVSHAEVLGGATQAEGLVSTKVLSPVEPKESALYHHFNSTEDQRRSQGSLLPTAKIFLVYSSSCSYWNHRGALKIVVLRLFLQWFLLHHFSKLPCRFKVELGMRMTTPQQLRQVKAFIDECHSIPSPLQRGAWVPKTQPAFLPMLTGPD